MLLPSFLGWEDVGGEGRGKGKKGRSLFFFFFLLPGLFLLLLLYLRIYYLRLPSNLHTKIDLSSSWKRVVCCVVCIDRVVEVYFWSTGA